MSVDISAFKRLQGCEIFSRDHLNYDQKRRIFNGLIDKRPSAIVYPEDTTALEQVFLTAMAVDVPISVRAGGHNVAGTSMIDDGIVIDTSRLHRVAVNREAKIAKIEPGAFWRDVDTILAKFDLCTPGGIISDTGVAGLTLGGGIGWLNGLYGLACDNLQSAQLLTADGQKVIASKEENEELLWALKGGGGNFGLVTEFTLSLHALPKIYAGSVVYSREHLRSALQVYTATCEAADDELTVSLVATTRKGERIVSLDACYAGDPFRGMKATESLLIKNGTSIWSDTRQKRSYVNWQRAFDEDIRRGLRSYWRSVFVNDPMDPIFQEIFARFFDNCPSEYTMLTFDHIHGAAARVPPDSTAYWHRDKMFLFLINTNWEHEQDDQKNIEWSDKFFHELRATCGAGNYVNYLSNEEDERVLLAYGPDTYSRLQSVKRQFDPNNVFSANQNIKL